MTPRDQTFRTRFGDAIRARPSAQGWFPPVLQVLLIAVWHALLAFAIFSPPSAKLCNEVVCSVSKVCFDLGLSTGYRTSISGGSTEEWRDGLAAAGVSVLLVPFEGVIAWVFFFVFVRVPRGYASGGIRLFVRGWWRAMLWATWVFPAVSLMLAVLASFDLDDLVFVAIFNVALWGYAAIVPAWLAHLEVHPRRRRLSRWRPLCPECGYSLRRLRADRCPECGVAFPTTSRTFRRWAVRRLAWDRLTRGSLAIDYLRTVFMIIVCPCRAGRRLCAPDRLPRAWRWAAAHIGLFAVAGLMLGSDFYFWGRAMRPFVQDMDLWHSEGWAWPPTRVAALWAGQSFVAWAIAVGTIPALGVLLGTVWPGRHPAARRSIAKWSLYAVVVLVPVALASYAVQLAEQPWPGSPGPYVAPWFIMSAWLPPTPPLWLLAVAYAIWWAAGVAANPYLPKRGLKVFVTHAAAFVVSWVLLTKLLFPADALGSLL